MQKHTDIDNSAIDNTLELVDLDDLRAAFGGEGLAAATDTSAQAQPVPSTVMCPSW
ncbi:MAG: hypothetical protein R3B09_00755 [Nannocystaceae bacterium]